MAKPPGRQAQQNSSVKLKYKNNVSNTRQKFFVLHANVFLYLMPAMPALKPHICKMNQTGINEYKAR